jgi:hypothetical protein
LNNALFDYFVENQQDFLNTLSTSARYEKVESDTQSITISHSEKSVYVYGEVSISTPGAHQGDGAKSFHGFPYEGKFFLNFDQEKIEKAEKLTIDDSSWYEE